MSHNKTLAAQLYSEFKNFFPDNAVEYFVSYFDYYQPEAYIPRTDTYIEKDSSINDEIERLRLSAMSRFADPPGRGGGGERVLHLRPGIAGRLRGHDGAGRAWDSRWTATIFSNGWWTCSTSAMTSPSPADKFRVRGDVVEVYPAYLDEEAIRVEFFGDEIERTRLFRSADRTWRDGQIDSYTFYPAKQFVTPADKMAKAVKAIREETGGAGRGLRERGQTAGGPAHQAAHRVRHRDDAGDGFLPGDRELLPPSDRPAAGFASRDT